MADNPVDALEALANDKSLNHQWWRTQDLLLEQQLRAALDEYTEIYVMTLEEGLEIARLHEAEAFGNFPRRGDAQATGGFQWRGPSPLTIWQSTLGGPAGSPISAAGLDAKNLQQLYKTLHAPGWESVTTKVKKDGTTVLVIKGKRGLRNPPWKNAHHKLTEARVIKLGIGVKGLGKSTVEGIKVGFYISAAIETLDFIFDDKKTVIDLFGGLIVEGFKAVIASLLGLAAGAAAASFAGLVITPIAVMAVVVFAVGMALNLLDEATGFKKRVVAWIKDLFGLRANELADESHSSWQINTDSPEWKAYVRQERRDKAAAELERMTHWGPKGRPLWLKPI
jgi:hypothetical protein